MDPISVAVVVAVLSLGSFLVYLFKSDYQERSRLRCGSQANKNDQQQHLKQGTMTNQNQASKSGAAICSIKQQTKFAAAGATGNNVTSKKNGDQTAALRHRDTPQSIQTISNSDTAGLVEPSSDELDSSVLTQVFDPTINGFSTKNSNPFYSSGKLDKKQAANHKQQNGAVDKPKRQKRQVPNSSEPSSELLFTQIAACNLSKDEIETAVEMLLNKSSDPDWTPSKSDPTQKVKNQLEQIKSELGKQQMLLQSKDGQLRRYELANKTLNEKVHELDSRLKSESEEKMNLLHRLEQASKLMNEKIHESESKLRKSELECENTRLALKDHHGRLKEVLEANSMLEKSLNELQLINGRQEDMLRRLSEERHVNEASMKRTLCEMEAELRELQTKLSASSANHEDRLRKELNQVEREQRLMAEMRELRDGLSALLPDIKARDIQVDADNWVHHYLGAVKQLARTVDELRANENNNCAYSPTKQLVDKSTLTPIHKNGKSSRVGSPTSNGRVSKAGSHQVEHDGDKKLMETKLLELSDYVAELEAEIQGKRASQVDNASLLSRQEQYERTIKELKLQKNKLEAQIKFGLDSLKMEQERASSLEKELMKFSARSSDAATATMQNVQ